MHKTALTLLFLMATTTIGLCQEASSDPLDALLDEISNSSNVRKALPVNPGEVTDEHIPTPKSEPTEVSPVPLPQNEKPQTERLKAPADEDGLEETEIFVMRTFRIKKKDEKEWQVMRIPIPVYYRTRSLAWNQNQITRALALQARINDYTNKLDILKQEGEMLQREYYSLLMEGVPTEILTANSPSLAEKKENTNSKLKSEGISLRVVQKETPEPELAKEEESKPKPTPKGRNRKK